MPQKDPEKRRAYMKAWAEKNADKVRANGKRYQEKNREKEKERQKRFYAENREKVLERQRQYREADPEGYRRRTAETQRRIRARDPERAREVSRRAHIKNKYGLTLEEYDEILARGCAICGTHEGRVVGKRNGSPPPPARLCLDHDHISGKIRDALCHTCNAGLGHFADDPARLRAAAEYLEAHCPIPSSTART